MDFRDRHVVITGGAGALGTAVVEALIGSGAICHIPCFNEAEAQRFALRDHKQVKLSIAGNLADEAAIGRVYGRSGRSGRRSISPAALRRGRCATPSVATLRQQIDMNLMTLPAVLPRGGRRHDGQRRPHRQCRRAAGARMAKRRRHGRLCGQQSCCRGADRGLGRGSRQGRHSGQRGRALDHGHAGQPQPPCRRPTSISGPKSRKSRPRSCFSPRRKTASPAAASFRCTGGRSNLPSLRAKRGNPVCLARARIASSLSCLATCVPLIPWP